MLLAKAQKRTLLRSSVKVPASEAEVSLPEVLRRLELVAPTLPVPLASRAAA